MFLWSHDLHNSFSHSLELYYCIKVICLDYWQKYVGTWIAYLIPPRSSFKSGSKHVTGVGGLCRSFHGTS